MTGLLRIPRRVRHELKFRTLAVASIEDLTPTYRRIVLEGADLDGFVSLGFDDHVKIFPVAEGQAPVLPTLGPDGSPLVFNIGLAVAGFLLFRVFDILKPPPANGLQRLGGGAGILVDDLIAGAMAGVLLQIAVRFLY